MLVNMYDNTKSIIKKKIMKNLLHVFFITETKAIE